MDPNLLENLILTPEEFLKDAAQTDFRQCIMKRMATPENQTLIELSEAKRDGDWAYLCNQVVGAEL